MKPVPKELQAYFPNVINADRPWWNREDVPMGFFVGAQWSRPDGYSTDALSDREEIDKANPMQPPPILVGQVWGAVHNGQVGSFEIQTIGPAQGEDGIMCAWGAQVCVPVADLVAGSFLLSCPFGYAPWSGVEVVP